MSIKIEHLVSELGLYKVLSDLRLVVENMAINCNDTDIAAKYWWLEQDLYMAMQDFSEE